MTRTFRAPGRVNLIGDHTDYSEGFVMPIAIQLETHVRVSRRPDRHLVITSTAATGATEIDLTRPLAPRRDWSDYVVGVAQVIMAERGPMAGANLQISSTVPQGAGLSSSAALEVASAFALLDGQIPDRVTLATWCQRAENEFVGARVGIMDQYVACLGQAGHALLIDCRSLTSRAVPIPEGIVVIVSNSMVTHQVAAGEYNSRRRQCEDAVQQLRAALPAADTLRDVSIDDLSRHKHLLTAITYKRAQHVVSENARVLAAADALNNHELATFGQLMRESHESLRRDFEVSVTEIDLLVDIACGISGVYGSRMTGGGFGGCTVTLADAVAADVVVQAIRREYRRCTGVEPDIVLCTPSAGASEVAP